MAEKGGGEFAPAEPTIKSAASMHNNLFMTFCSLSL
jgi:hypothetical protein